MIGKDDIEIYPDLDNEEGKNLCNFEGIMKYYFDDVAKMLKNSKNPLMSTATSFSFPLFEMLEGELNCKSLGRKFQDIIDGMKEIEKTKLLPQHTKRAILNRFKTLNNFRKK